MTSRQASRLLIRVPEHEAPKGYVLDDPPGAAGVVVMEVSWDLQEELEAELQRAGATPLPRPHYLRLDVPTYATVVLAAAPGVWLTLRTAIRALADRNKQKTFRLYLGDAEMIADGHSVKDVTRLLETAQTLFERQTSASDETEGEALSYAAVEQAARQLLVQRDGLAVDEHISGCLDRMAQYIDDPRLWELVVVNLDMAVDGLVRLERDNDRPSAVTPEATLSLNAAAEILKQFLHTRR
ncbi:hypothetical protein AB0950_40075 [Streptomyces sp. NPDC007189]|uniref:hypothetical protein n=1 Tax=Streptomyces sp. NPDC007189 TaxID=3154315 RepID=UPI003454D7AA